MKKIILALLIAGCLITGCSAASTSDSASYRQVTAEEAMEIMETAENYIILDVRRQDEFESLHIPGAICIPNETIGTTPPYRLPDKDQLILVYCRSGNRSKQAAKKLAAMGYTNIVEFGGINNWHGETVTGAE